MRIFNAIRIVNMTASLTSTMIVNLVVDAYTDIPIKCVLYKMDMIKMRCEDVLYL